MNAPNSQNLRVAVVDDDATLLSMLNELLTEEGYVVSAFADGKQAQKAAYHSGFDIVISDINMPEVTGIELLRYLREIGSKALVIIMTANADMKSAIEAVRLGAYDYLTKPFDDISLVVKLVNRAANKILNEKRQEHMVQAVIEKTKQIIAYQKPQDLPADLKDLLNRTEQMVRELQPGANDEAIHQITGKLQEIGLPNLLQMLAVVGKSGILTIQAPGASGEIWLASGRIIYVQCGKAKGAKGLFRLLAQGEGQFRFTLNEAKPPDENVQTSTEGVILECLRCIDEYKRLGRRVPPAELCLRLTPSVPSDLPPDDQQTVELILRYTKVGDILDYSPRQDLDTVHSLIRLRMAGLLDIYYV